VTATEACALAVDLTRQLRTARAGEAAWQQLAFAAFAHCTDLRQQLDMVDERQYIYRTRTQDARDLFLDHVDLRRQVAA
jgi:hypothetical protein